jgi:hypothetical protein
MSTFVDRARILNNYDLRYFDEGRIACPAGNLFHGAKQDDVYFLGKLGFQGNLIRNSPTIDQKAWDRLQV